MPVLPDEILQHLQDHPAHILRPQEKVHQNGGQTGRDPDCMSERPLRLSLCAQSAGGQGGQPGGDIPAAGPSSGRGGGPPERSAHGRGAPHLLPLLPARAGEYHLLGAS